LIFGIPEAGVNRVVELASPALARELAGGVRALAIHAPAPGEGGA
jgi:hypothetical protein